MQKRANGITCAKRLSTCLEKICSSGCSCDCRPLCAQPNRAARGGVITVVCALCSLTESVETIEYGCISTEYDGSTDRTGDPDRKRVGALRTHNVAQPVSANRLRKRPGMC
eukprot:8489812-Pyramimonas_sp.AAC.2